MKRKTAGFTLLELMVALAIVAIGAALAFPTFADYRVRARLKGAGRDLYSTMQRARINALRDHSSWAIQFEPGSGRYHLISDPGADGEWGTLGDNDIEKTMVLSDYGNISFGTGDAGPRPGASEPGDGCSFNNERVVFNSDGTTSINGTVYVKNEKGYCFAVDALGATGRLKAWAEWGNGWEG